MSCAAECPNPPLAETNAALAGNMWGLGFRDISPTMQNQMEKKIVKEMETVVMHRDVEGSCENSQEPTPKSSGPYYSHRVLI